MKETQQLSQHGFTLIELMIVISLMAIMGGFGFVSLRSYTENRTATEQAGTFATAVKLARSRAQTQVKPSTGSTCTNAPLDGYKVKLTCTTTCQKYAVVPVCGQQEDTAIASDSFSNVKVELFDASGSYATPEFTFQTLTGAVTNVIGHTTIRFTAPSGTAVSVTVYDDGRILSEQ